MTSFCGKRRIRQSLLKQESRLRETKELLSTSSWSSSSLIPIPKVNLIILLALLIVQLGKGGEGLHPPQCQWSLYQGGERLNCFVETGNNLIVEEEVYGIGPEHAKSLWIQCSDNNYLNQQLNDYQSESNNNNHNNNGGGFVLSHGVFMAVPNLRELKLENCRIAGMTPGALSYLPYLQNLTLRAQSSLHLSSSSSPSSFNPNSPSSSSGLLEVKAGVFRGLNDLRHLDLSTTSLNSLPQDFLCGLPQLTHLNLSSCWLRDFRSIGINPPPHHPTNPAKSGCQNQLNTLDLSGNHFNLLPPATFAALPSLSILRLDHNSITIAAERALLALSHLKVFSMAGNALTSLPPEFFKDNPLLKEIYLQNNSLAVLAPGLFNGLQHLLVLDLSNNELTSEWVNGETFKGLIRLVVLNLANNQLAKIDGALFRDLSNLQVLNLENNKLTNLSASSFSSLVNIHTLLLSHNQLLAVQSFLCTGLSVLSFLALDNNKIVSIDEDCFKNCSSLLDLNLSGNKLTSVPMALTSLSLLRTLDLGENQIADISNASYQNLQYLYGLRLTANSIEKVPANAFLNLPSLKIVNLAKNNISIVDSTAFVNNPNLQAVRLDSNRLVKISGLFNSIPNLLWLNISGNSVEDLNYSDFPPKLQWLDLRSNKIEKIGSVLDLESPLRIRNLDLSHNLLKEIGSSNFPDALENLVLNNNKIHQIQPYTFFRKPNLTRVDLSRNRLGKLDQNAFRLSPNRLINAEILLGGNPFECDCTMQWLQNMNTNSGQYPTIVDVSEVKCSLTFDRVYSSVEIRQSVVSQVSASQFVCKYETRCPSVCGCCDFDACDCELTCPKNCSCFHSLEWETNLVDCSLAGRSEIPAGVPMDVTELYLDGNVFPSPDSHSFIGRRNLRSLFLNSSHVESIQNRTFHGLPALRILHLEDNFLERLLGYEFEDLDNLQELYLQHNSLRWIANQTFSRLTKLRVLWLHGNNFVHLAIWQSLDLSSSSSSSLWPKGAGGGLFDLTLRGNEWSCDCEFASQLRSWLMDNANKISDAHQIQCVDQVKGNSSSSTVNSGGNNNNPQIIVVRLLEEKNPLCLSSDSDFEPSSGFPASTDLNLRESSSSFPSSGKQSNNNNNGGGNVNELMVILISVMSTLFLVLVFLSLVAYYWRESLRVWIHSHCGLRLDGHCFGGEPPADREKLFDAFVSYSSKDEAWVRQVLAAELERNDPPYRLCLRYRDLPTGGTYLADTIVQASEASRRTVLVLSHHFLKDEWSRTDVKSAHHSVLKDGTRRVILILLGDLPSRDLDPDIRLYLKNHTYLNCEDKRFWQKLRYALPDVKAKLPMLSISRNTHSSSRGADTNPQNPLSPNCLPNSHGDSENPSLSLGRPNPNNKHKKPLPPIPVSPSIIRHHRHLQVSGGPQILANNYMPIGNLNPNFNNSVYNNCNINSRTAENEGTLMRQLNFNRVNGINANSNNIMNTTNNTNINPNRYTAIHIPQ